uniref:Phage protein n=1 Tax=Caenorhabditis tropicalis TaxID=1561998 RepID=A0A1I7TEJ4_9PELO
MFSSEGKFRKTYRHQFNQLRYGDETEIPMSTLASRIETRKIPLSDGQIEAIREAPDELVDVDGFQRIVTLLYRTSALAVQQVSHDNAVNVQRKTCDCIVDMEYPDYLRSIR